MDRNEAKVLMRKELEQDIDSVKREEKMFPIGNRMLSANDLMKEVEDETELGVFLLDDFIAFKAGKMTDDSVLSAIERHDAISMMEEDIKAAPAGWADEVIFNEEGQSWTPNQVLDEVRRRTDFGNRFVATYLANHRMLEKLLGKGYEDLDMLLGEGHRPDHDIFSLPPVNTKVKNDKTN